MRGSGNRGGGRGNGCGTVKSNTGIIQAAVPLCGILTGRLGMTVRGPLRVVVCHGNVRPVQERSFAGGAPSVPGGSRRPFF